MFRSDELFEEIIYMVDQTAAINVTLMTQCLTWIQQGQQVDHFDFFFHILNSGLHIILSHLSQEECPDYYADKLDQIIPIFDLVLQYQNDDLSYLVKCKAKVIKAIEYYGVKFQEDFPPEKINHYFGLVWGLLSTSAVSPNKKNSKMIAAIISYCEGMSFQQQILEFFKTNLGTLM